MSGAQLYVYWRVAAADLAAAVAATRQMQAGLLAAWPGLQAELLQRCDADMATSETTLMEIYRHLSGVSPELRAAIDRAAEPLRRWRRGERHVEVFAGVPEP